MLYTGCFLRLHVFKHPTYMNPNIQASNVEHEDFGILGGVKPLIKAKAYVKACTTTNKSSPNFCKSEIIGGGGATTSFRLS